MSVSQDYLFRTMQLFTEHFGRLPMLKMMLQYLNGLATDKTFTDDYRDAAFRAAEALRKLILLYK